jgi:hypothetical protein
MRLRATLSLFVALLSTTLLPACQGEEPGGIEASVELSQIDVNPAAPDTNASLNITVELQARGQPEDVSLVSVTITEQPVSDASRSLALEVAMVDTQTNDPVARLGKGEARVVRMINRGTTNGDLADWCRLPVQLEVVVETADDEEAVATANATVRCP